MSVIPLSLIEEGEFSYLALDFYDNAWVTDSVTCQIHKLDKDLRYITSFGQCGDDDYEFDHPTGIAIWRRFGQMVIAERHSAQYLWIGSDISRLDAQVGVDNKGNPAVNIYIYLTDRSFLTVNVLKDDKVIAGLFDQRRFKQGARTLYWDMKDDKDRRVEPGKYTIQVKVEPTYSSFGYFDKTVSTEVEIP